MTCRNRNCSEPLSNTDVFCPFCGYVNGEIINIPKTIEVKVYGNKACKASFKLQNNRVAPIEVKLRIEDDPKGLFVFEENGKASCSFEVTLDKIIDIQFVLPDDDNNLYTAKLVMITNDGVDSEKRGEALYYERLHNLTLDIVFAKRGRLEILKIQKNIVVFNADHKTESICIKHVGNEPITITGIKMPKGFCAPDTPPGTVIDSGLDKHIRIVYDPSVQTDHVFGSMKVVYEVWGEEASDEIALFATHVPDPLDEYDNLPDNIIAVDFGTSKTSMALLEYSKIYNEQGEIDPQVEMIQLGTALDKEPEYDIPSAIALENGAYKIGKLAKSARIASYYAESIKMQLQSPTIKLERSGSEAMTVASDALLIEYMRHLQELLPENIKDENNLFVFTVPVLDKNDSGEQYEKQVKMTVDSAVKSGLAEKGWTKIITEPEAALYYMIHKNKKTKTKSIELEEGNTICLFDFGAGTLDVLLGKYTLKNGIPAIIPEAVYGEFKVFNEVRTVGGNFFDDLIAIETASERVDSIDDFGMELNSEGVMIDFEKFGTNSEYYTSMSKVTFREQYAKQVKEMFGFKEDDVLPMDGTDAYTGEQPSHGSRYGSLSFDISRNVIDHMVNAVMQDILKDLKQKQIESNISNIDYIFMVGGTSLLHGALNSVNVMFGSKNVFNPREGYPIVIKDEDKETRIELRTEAVYPVVKGAALSAVFRINRNFAFDLSIVSDDESEKILFERKAGDELSKGNRKSLRKSLSVAARKWVIYALPPNEETRYRLGHFDITEFLQDLPSKIKSVSFWMDVDADRMLKIQYEVVKDMRENIQLSNPIYV